MSRTWVLPREMAEYFDGTEAQALAYDRLRHQTHVTHNQEVDMASVVSGSVTIGGTVFGAVEADVKLDDGTSWHFAGYYADCGAGVGVCNSPSGDFPGESHMSGSCFMSVVQVPGGFGVSFDDFHGHIGTLGGVFIGAVIELGIGGGAWTKENGAEVERRELKAGDKISVELEHELVGQKAEEDDDDGA